MGKGRRKSNSVKSDTLDEKADQETAVSLNNEIESGEPELPSERTEELKEEAAREEVVLEDEENDKGSDVKEAEAIGKKEEGSKEKSGKKRIRKGRRGKDITTKASSEGTKTTNQVVEFAGLIFMCNTSTKKDCFKYRVFGLPEAKRKIVEQVKKGIKLFLFDIDQKLLYGIYKASSAGGMNLQAEAFKDSERKFPAQVFTQKIAGLNGSTAYSCLAYMFSRLDTGGTTIAVWLLLVEMLFFAVSGFERLYILPVNEDLSVWELGSG